MDRIQKRPRESKSNMEQDQRERERNALYKGQAEEIFSRERDRWREEGSYTNGRVPLMQEHDEHREREKGDTFPRIRKRSNERDRRVRHSVDQGYERVMEQDIRRLVEMDKSERERERIRRRERDTQAQRYYENDRSRLEANINEGRTFERGNIDRMRVSGWDLGKKDRRPERPTEVGVTQIARYRDADRERDRQEQRERGDWAYPQQRRILMKGDVENFSDREGIRGGPRERHRYTKSEGDTDEEYRREVRQREDDPNKGDVEGEKARRKWKEKERRKEVERQKERDREKDREPRRGERYREQIEERYTKHHRERDRRERDWTRPHRNPQDRQRDETFNERIENNTEKGRMRSSTAEREISSSLELENSIADRISLTQSQMQGETPSREEGPSGSYLDNDQRKREVKHKLKDKETEISFGIDRGEEREQREEVKIGFEAERERERDKPENKQRPYRKMWLEPRADREKPMTLQEENTHRERAREKYAHRHEESYTQRYKEQMTERDVQKDKEKYSQRDEKQVRERDSQRHEERYARINEEQARESYPQIENQVHKNNIQEGYPQIREDQARDENSQIVEEQARERYAQISEEQKKLRDEEDEVTQMIIEDKDQEICPKCIPDDRERIVRNEYMESADQDDDVTYYQTEKEQLADRIEAFNKAEESGSETCDQSDREDDSDGEWEERKDKITSIDDGFVTVSSGLDDDEADEDLFEDCKEFWDSGDREDCCRRSPTGGLQDQGEIEARMTHVGGDHKVTVFCVVGKTLPRSGSQQNPCTDHLKQASEQVPYGTGDEGCQDTVPIRQTHLDPTLEEELQTNPDFNPDSAEYDEVPTPEEESVMLMDNTDTVHSSVASTETDDNESLQENRDNATYVEKANVKQENRYSALPHVKWAKNVLSEILGSSEDGTLNTPEPSDGVPSEAEDKSTLPTSPLYGVVHKLHNRDRHELDTESSHTKQNDSDTLVQSEILIHVQQDSEGEEELEQLSQEEETDEEAEYFNLPGPELNSLSSEEEGGKEEISKKNEKQKKKSVWQMISSSSLRDLGHEALGRRRKGIRRTVQKQKDEAKEEEAGRDRRTRIFPSDNEYDELSSTWSEMDIRSIKGTLSRSRMRTSKYYNSQLYQQYSEVVQDRELLHQSNSDSVFGEVGVPHIPSSPSPSPPLARRPLPPLPPISYTKSLPHPTSVSSLNENLAIPHSSLPRPPSPLRTKSFASSPMLWQDLPGVKNNPETKNLSQDERRLQEVRFEVVTSEASYCSSLDIVVEHFVKSKQLNSHLNSQDKNWLFSRLCDVRALSHSFFTQLEGRVESNIMHFTVCDIIIKHCPRFRSVYVPYLTNQSYQDKTYQRLINENSGFRHTVETLEQSPKCQRLPFRSFLILPFQRITRLKLLVQNILKRTAPKSKDEAHAIKAMKLLEKMIQDSNDSITQMKSIESLVSLNAKVDFECKTLPLISQSRRLVREGTVTELRDFAVKERERTVYIHLFNDYLLASLPKESGRFMVIDHAPVSELRAENCSVKLHSLSKNVFRLHLANRSLILRTDTQADKLRWISALSRPHPEIDFNTAQDRVQMQCIRAFMAQQPDELGLEKADVLLVLQQSIDGWVEGTRLSDRQRGWVPKSHLEIIKSDKARQSNLIDALKITTATATD